MRSLSWKLLPVAAWLAVCACVIENHANTDNTKIYTPPDGGLVVEADAGDGGVIADAGPVTTNAISGTIAGATPTLVEAIAMDSTQLGEGVTGDVWMLLSDTAGMCSRITNGAGAANAGALSFYLVATDGFGAFKAADPATYIFSAAQPGPNQHIVYASYAHNDAACQQTTVAFVDGFVTLDSVGISGSGFTSGRFDFTFQEGHVTGSFVATTCGGPVRAVTFCQ